MIGLFQLRIMLLSRLCGVSDVGSGIVTPFMIAIVTVKTM